MKYSLCTECDGRLWAVESKESDVCAECRMKDDCNIQDLEDMFEEVLK